MSTYLQLCTYLRQETTDAGTGPSAVTGQVGELARIVKWIADAWREIQNDRDWFWMRRSFTVSATSGDGEYAYTDCTDTTTSIAIARFSKWYENSFKCYLTSAGVGAEYSLIWVDWESFRRTYRYGTQTNSAPIYVSMDPTRKFCLGPKPDATYTVSGDFKLGPQTLSADADEPELPTEYHNLIVYEAMSKYGGHRVAPEAIMRAQAEGGRLRYRLEQEHLPPITASRTMA